MDDAETAIQQQLPAALRSLQPAALQALQHPQAHALASQLAPDLQSLDAAAQAHAFQQQLHADLTDPTNAHHLRGPPTFDPTHRQLHAAHANGLPHTPHRQHAANGQFNMLTPAMAQFTPATSQQYPPQSAAAQLQQEAEFFATPDGAGKNGGDGGGLQHNMKLIADPPNLAEWREKLFNVNETIFLSEDEFQTYFPHVDNVYSHRSTQRYKRKPLVSHYWDCRLKGRPPGTPKSDDPNKKKRRRVARERDLCDVKIKITEYFPNPLMTHGFGNPQMDGTGANNFFAPGQPGAATLQQQQAFSILTPDSDIPPAPPSLVGQKYYTIQRVNGNGGNGKGDGVAGPHKHTLEDSDRVKKNSVQRYILKEEKEKKRTQEALLASLSNFTSFMISYYSILRPRSRLRLSFLTSKHLSGSRLLSSTRVSLKQNMANQNDGKKTYHKKATGNALTTVKKHSKESEMKLFGSCFCPFVQRVWVALEAKGLNYQYIEVDPYKKPEQLLEVNPRGLVPALLHGNWGCYESTVLLEYLEDLHAGNPLLPPNDPQLRAHCRLWADHINRHIVPCFYRCLQAQELDKQIDAAEELKTEISKVVDVAHPVGPYFLGSEMSFVDVHFAPWVLRLARVLKPYRGWPDPEEGSRWSVWIDALEKNEAIRATTSTDELYLDSYERYAENRPNTSQLANAVNGGRGLP